MPGTIVFKPLEAKFNIAEDPKAKLEPYCKFKLGWHTAKTNHTVNHDMHVKWVDIIHLQRNHDETYAKLKVKDLGRLGDASLIGEAKIDLEVVVANKRVTQWYNLYHKDKLTGEILLDIEFCPPL